MGNDRYRQQQPDLVAALADLKDRVSKLERISQIGTTAIDYGSLMVGNGNIVVGNNGEVIIKDNSGNTIIELGKTSDGRYGLRVNDTSGNPQIRLGQLASSSAYGLEAIGPSGVLTTLSNYIFGPQTASVAADESTSSTTYTDLTTVGPSVTVDIPTAGRVLVLWGCEARFDDNTTNGAMGAYASVALSGNNTIAASDSWRSGYYQQQLNTTSNNIEFHGAQIHVFSGLTPGNTTFTMKYRVFDGTKTARFITRTIAVHLF